MTNGFIDSASLHSALAALSRRGDRDLSAWDHQSLIDCTYLLLFHKMGIVPGPGGYRGASGLYEHVVTRLHSLEEKKFSTTQALRSTKAWLTRHPSDIRTAWDRTRAQPEFHLWAAKQRDLFWLDHVRMHLSLFNAELVPHIASLLGVSVKELQRLNLMSQDEMTVGRWLRSRGDDAILANDAWLAAGLIRGKVHEYIAVHNGLHLAGHPFRKLIEKPLRSGQGEPVFNSEEYFVKILIGSALLETSEERRAQAWVGNIAKAREAIEGKRVALPQTTDSVAERLAADAARYCGISASYSRIRRELEVATSLLIRGLLSVGISPWIGPLGPIAVATYRHYRGVSVGDDIDRFIVGTTRRFRWLARNVPGRIVRTLK